MDRFAYEAVSVSTKEKRRRKKESCCSLRTGFFNPGGFSIAQKNWYPEKSYLGGRDGTSGGAGESPLAYPLLRFTKIYKRSIVWVRLPKPRAH
ncbi:MAG: hypothetical protein UW78_C0001G0002 [Candidatus Azambacteria bacterium GW2011_GWA1_44_9]|uniref:Uncharacterized protein n=1 Tax=Candidatus Azambacteria bacterium GW2011_GWA1_44_9 TaxID=1618610 RepID=A0A0G1NDG1_9BACT|nr:MAG: hypothetical protein UW78_C0001G0002 [Candidatus Azambacteria bacterium GW2011_GWA1_44_9]